MKIYAVIDAKGEFSDYHICALFDDEKKADLYCEMMEEKDFLDNKYYVFGDEYIIEEFDTDDVNIEGTVYYGVRAVIYEGVEDLFNDYTTFRSVSPILDSVTETIRYCRDSMKRKKCKIYAYAIDESTYNDLKNDTFAIRDYIKERMNNE